MEINHGVIIGSRPTDWVAGKIPYEVRNSSGDWTGFKVRNEKQWFTGFDTLACVSFACNNAAEIQILQQTGQEVNFSDRYLAKMSGTTTQGNWVYIVLDTWRMNGVVLEPEWPAPPEPTNWGSYYSEIPEYIRNKAPKESLARYSLQYEVISDLSSDSLTHHLKHAPLMVTLPGHEVVGLKVEGNTLTYFDTYEAFIKTINISNIQAVYKAVFTVLGDKMIGYKKAGDLKVYVELSGKLVPIADWDAFVAMGGSLDSIVELNEQQLSKFNLVSGVLFKKE